MEMQRSSSSTSLCDLPLPTPPLLATLLASPVTMQVLGGKPQPRIPSLSQRADGGVVDEPAVQLRSYQGGVLKWRPSRDSAPMAETAVRCESPETLGYVLADSATGSPAAARETEAADTSIATAMRFPRTPMATGGAAAGASAAAPEVTPVEADGFGGGGEDPENRVGAGAQAAQLEIRKSRSGSGSSVSASVSKLEKASCLPPHSLTARRSLTGARRPVRLARPGLRRPSARVGDGAEAQRVQGLPLRRRLPR